MVRLDVPLIQVVGATRYGMIDEMIGVHLNTDEDHDRRPVGDVPAGAKNASAALRRIL